MRKNIAIPFASQPSYRKTITALFHLPVSIFRRCFSDRDLDRLRTFYVCHFPEGDTRESLQSAWERHQENTEIVITGWDSPPITDEMLDQSPRLQAIIHSAGSIKPFIPSSIWDRNIRVATCNDALGKGVAETTLALIIGGLKGFFPCATLTRANQWQNAVPATGYGRVRELFNVTIGIIGASRTGRHVIRLLSNFDVKVLLYDPTVSSIEADELGCVYCEDLFTLLGESDVVSLHAPPLPSLRHMLSFREFAQMKDDAIFINTARGMLVNEDALVRELETGRISAILDITYPEPPADNHPFRTLPNVVLLPHIAGALSTGCFRQGQSTVDQLLEFVKGERLSGEIAIDRFAAMA